MNTEKWIEHCKASLMIGFMGDSLGSAYEFPERTKLKNENAIESGRLTSFKRHNRHTTSNKLKPVKFERGIITDDSIFTIDLLSSLAKKESIEDRLRRYYDIVHNGGEFADENCGMFGQNTRVLFKNLQYKDNYKKQFGVKVGKLAKNEPESNGFLMRCSPLAFKINDEDLEERIRQDVMITNPTQNCIDIATFYINLLRMGLSGKSPREVYHHVLIDNPECLQKMVEKIQSGKTFKPTKDSSKSGWAFVAMYYALLALKKMSEGEFVPEILSFIVKEGGDTDTNAAIAGFLIGSFLTMENIEQNEILNANKNDIMSDYRTEIIKYRKVPEKDWKKICKRLNKLVMQNYTESISNKYPITLEQIVSSIKETVYIRYSCYPEADPIRGEIMIFDTETIKDIVKKFTNINVSKEEKFYQIACYNGNVTEIINIYNYSKKQIKSLDI